MYIYMYGNTPEFWAKTWQCFMLSTGGGKLFGGQIILLPLFPRARIRARENPDNFREESVQTL